MAVTNWTDLYATNTAYFTPAGGFYAPILPTSGSLPNWVNDLVDALRIWPANVSANGHALTNLNNMSLVAGPGAANVLYLNAPSVGGSWVTVGNFNAYRYIQTATDAIDPAARFKALAVGAGGIGIGMNPPVYGDQSGLLVNAWVGIATSTPHAPLHAQTAGASSAISPAGQFTAIVENRANGTGQNGLLVKQTWQATDSSIVECWDGVSNVILKLDGIGNLSLSNRSHAVVAAASGVGVVGLAQAESAPTASPANGVLIYVDGSGNLVCRTRAGNTRIIAAV